MLSLIVAITAALTHLKYRFLQFLHRDNNEKKFTQHMKWVMRMTNAGRVFVFAEVDYLSGRPTYRLATDVLLINGSLHFYSKPAPSIPGFPAVPPDVNDEATKS